MIAVGFGHHQVSDNPATWFQLADYKRCNHDDYVDYLSSKNVVIGNKHKVTIRDIARILGSKAYKAVLDNGIGKNGARD